MFLNNSIQVQGLSSIVSLVPSLTELLYNLGLEAEVTGITKFCVHPAHWQKEKIGIGGTKTVDIKKVKSLTPTLIIANKEENVKSQVEDLADYPVWVTDVNNLEDACEMITDLGRITRKEKKAEVLVKEIMRAFTELETVKKPVHVAYLIWKKPFMSIGGDTFIHDMLTRTGMRNVFADKRRYPVVSIEDIRNSGCEVLLLSSEPYPFKAKHVAEFSHLLPGVSIKVVDGEMFSWYGSRLLKSPLYFKNLQADLATL